MSDPLLKQKDYWNRAIDHFDSIYSHEKSFIGNLVDRLVRWDMYQRFSTHWIKLSRYRAGPSLTWGAVPGGTRWSL